MTSSGKLRVDGHLSYSKQSTFENRDYPRGGQIRILRTVFLFCWSLVVWYLGNAVWNLYQLIHTDVSRIFGYKYVLDALVLPSFLVRPNTPLWVFIAFAVPFLPILLGCVWATKDLQRENKFLQAQQIQDEVQEDLKSRGVDGQFPKPQGPPNDITRIPYPGSGRMVGRAADLGWLLKRLKSGKINSVTAIHGLGGIGKTALVAEALNRLDDKRFRGGIAVVSCQGISTVSEVIQNVLARFDPYRLPPETNNLAELENIARKHLDGKDALIVLDNIEPTLTIKDVIGKLLAVKGIILLLNSRHVLPVSAEDRLEIGPLSIREAVKLFIQSLGSHMFNEGNTDEYDAVVNIVEKLGCHTLAIKIVGAYASSRKRDLKTLAQELNTLNAIEIGGEDETPKAVALAFTQSTQALPDEAKRLFDALAAFSSIEFSRRAALALARELFTTTAEQNLDLLVPRALVEAFTIDSMSLQSDRERLRLHPLMHAFAESRFANWADEEQLAVKQSIAKYYAEYVNKISDVALLSYDEVNIMGTLEWAHQHKQDETVVAICTGMQHLWLSRWRTDFSLSYLPQGVEAAKSIAQRSNKPEDYLRAAMLALTYGQVLLQVGNLNEAKETFEETLIVLRQMKNQQGEAETLASLGKIAQQRGRLEEAKDDYEQSLHIFLEINNEQGVGEIRTLLGEVAQQQGRLKDAESYFVQSLGILRRITSRNGQAHNLVRLGEIAQYREDVKGAEQYYGEALTITNEVQNRQEEGWVLLHIGNIAEEYGQREEAATYYTKALIIAREVQHRQGESWVLTYLGRLALANGQHALANGQHALANDQLEEAEKRYEESLTIARKVEDRREEGRLQACLGELMQMRGLSEKSGEYYIDALTIADEVQDRINYANTALSFGILLHTSDKENGCSKIEEAKRIYAFMKIPKEYEARRISRQNGCGR